MGAKLKIAYVLHGRFPEFELAKAMLRRGHDVTVFINYPKWACEKFSLPKEFVESFWIHGVVSRFIGFIARYMRVDFLESKSHEWFSVWAAKKLQMFTRRGCRWDVIFVMSGVALEILKCDSLKYAIQIIARDSSHIREQAEILLEEEVRVGVNIDKPAKWSIEREENEYKLADAIKVLSSFNYETFRKRGTALNKLILNVSAFSCDEFKVKEQIVKERTQRILAEDSLRILFVGTLCFRKGMWDLRSIILSLGEENLKFKLVGPIARECSGMFDDQRTVEVVGKKTQKELTAFYNWADLFIFPSLEEGFAQVLVQAASQGLPILATQHSGAEDMIESGKNGWIFPIREPEFFVKKLLWCLSNRVELADIVKNTHRAAGSNHRTWNQVAAEAEEAICRRLSK